MCSSKGYGQQAWCLENICNNSLLDVVLQLEHKPSTTFMQLLNSVTVIFLLHDCSTWYNIHEMISLVR